MGTDNSGYLVVGNKFDDIDFSNFPKFDEVDENDDISEFYCGEKLIELKLDWELMEPCGYQPSGVFGYCLRSPSYGIATYDLADFAKDLAAIYKVWPEWTGKIPKIFVLNIQS